MLLGRGLYKHIHTFPTTTQWWITWVNLSTTTASMLSRVWNFEICSPGQRSHSLFTQQIPYRILDWLPSLFLCRAHRVSPTRCRSYDIIGILEHLRRRYWFGWENQRDIWIWQAGRCNSVSWASMTRTSIFLLSRSVSLPWDLTCGFLSFMDLVQSPMSLTSMCLGYSESAPIVSSLLLTLRWRSSVSPIRALWHAFQVSVLQLNDEIGTRHPTVDRQHSRSRHEEERKGEPCEVHG